MTALEVAFLVAAWAAFLAFRQTRTLRTVAFLAALTAIYVAANALVSPWRPLIRVIVIPAVIGAVVLRYDWLIWSMSRAELDYDDFIHDIAERLHASNRTDISDPAGRTEQARRYREEQRRLEGRAVPHRDWETLRDRLLDHIRFNLDVYEDRRPADWSSGGQAATNWNAVREEWKRVRRSRSSFWR